MSQLCEILINLALDSTTEIYLNLSERSTGLLDDYQLCQSQ